MLLNYASCISHIIFSNALHNPANPLYGNFVQDDFFAVKNEKGGVVFTCPVCGAVNEIAYISRREARVKVRMPKWCDCG